MKLKETILLSLSAAFLLIGIHQAMKFGVQNSYFFFMLSAGLFLWYTLRKKQGEENGKARNPNPAKQKGKK